jgi:hypothetical protein
VALVKTETAAGTSFRLSDLCRAVTTISSALETAGAAAVSAAATDARAKTAKDAPQKIPAF